MVAWLENAMENCGCVGERGDCVCKRNPKNAFTLKQTRP
jgi:hypothetical protein